METTIRRLGPEDAPLVLASRDVFDAPCDPDWTREFFARPGHAMVGAIESGDSDAASGASRLVGMASGAVLLHPDKPPQFFVNEVATAATHYRRGIAARMMQELIAVARSLGCVDIWLATEDDNTPARALYARAGGRPTEGLVLYDWPADPA